DLVADPDLEIAVGIADVFLLDPSVMGRDRSPDWPSLKACDLPQAGIEGHANLVPVAEFTQGLIVAVEVGAFQVAKMADVMHRAISAGDSQRSFTLARKLDAAREDDIEDHIPPLVGFAPYSEVLGESIAKDTAFMAIGANRESDGGGRPHVG